MAYQCTVTLHIVYYNKAQKKRIIPNGYILTISQAILYLNGTILIKKILEVLR